MQKLYDMLLGGEGWQGNNFNNRSPITKNDPFLSFYETLYIAQEVKRQMNNPRPFPWMNGEMKTISNDFYKMLEMFLACHSILWTIYAYQVHQKKKFS